MRSWARVERALLVRASTTALSCLILDHLETHLIREGFVLQGLRWLLRESMEVLAGYGILGENLLRTYCGLSLESAHCIDDEHQGPVRSFETSVRSCAPLHVKRNGLNDSGRPT